MILGYTIINASICFAGMMLCFLGMLMVELFRSIIKKSRHHFFMVFFLCLILDLAVNLCGELLCGSTSESAHAVQYAMYYIHFFLSPMLAFIILGYLLVSIGPGPKRRVLTGVTAFMFVLGLAILLAAQIYRLYFYIDKNGYFVKADTYFISLVVSLCPALLILYCLAFDRNTLSRHERTAMLSYGIIPAAAIVVQFFIPGVRLIVPATIIAALIMFIFILSGSMKRYYRQEQEQDDVRMTVMLSQIQPHFLYNVLDSIYYLCGKDPKAAQKAIADFSKYLRVNLKSLTQKKPVPFELEERHTRTYLELEKMSLGSELEYEFDCKVKDFEIPVLTLQPIVENSVKHGLANKQGGGKIWISTEAVDGNVIVTVSDNGSGFNIEETLKDANQHLGLENIKRRLKMQSCGSLEISSTPGKGTTSQIILPCKEAGSDEDFSS